MEGPTQDIESSNYANEEDLQPFELFVIAPETFEHYTILNFGMHTIEETSKHIFGVG